MNRQALIHQPAPRGIVDLFAGPGGWSEGLRMLGHSELGIELDEHACATARAAGHERLQADVASLNPLDYQCWGLIGSPPCPTFSTAGKGAGRRDMDHVIACSQSLAAGIDNRDEHRAACEDERSMLVVEPLRWALDLHPEWIALEQVPPVLELWEMFGHILERRGYSVWVGVLEAERYGVPQTRERAILMASRVRAVHPPRATHQRYVPGQPRRRDETLEGTVLPWVSMAEALGWGMTERPGMTFAPGTSNGGAAYEGGSGARASLRRERERGAWVVQTGNFTAIARDADGERSKAGSVPYERAVDQPAPTLGTPHRHLDARTAVDDAHDRRARIRAPQRQQGRQPQQGHDPGHGAGGGRAPELPARLPVAGRQEQGLPADRQRRPAPARSSHLGRTRRRGVGACRVSPSNLTAETRT